MLELNFTPFPVLTTERLVLRKLTLQDTPEIFVLRSHPVIQRFIKRVPPKTHEEAAEWIAKMLRQEENNETVNWGIALKGSTQVIGSICLWNIEKDEYKAEVGYSLHHDFFRKGIMGEALARVAAYGFDTMHLRRIDAFTNKDNAASLALLEKHGFQRNTAFEAAYGDKEELEYNVIYTRLADGF